MSPRLTKPVVHGRDHSAGGSDPIPGGVGGAVQWEDVGSGAGGAAYGYGAATVYPDPSIAANFSGLLTWTEIHSNGVTISGTNITINTPGTYEILAAGGGYLSGPATNPQLEMQLEINGGIGAVPHYAHPIALSPMDIPSGRTWIAPMTLLAQRALVATDVLRLRAVNASNAVAYFVDWHIVVKQLQ